MTVSSDTCRTFDLGNQRHRGHPQNWELFLDLYWSHQEALPSLTTDKKEKTIFDPGICNFDFDFKATLNIKFKNRDRLGFSLKKIKAAVVFCSGASFRNWFVSWSMVG